MSELNQIQEFDHPAFKNKNLPDHIQKEESDLVRGQEGVDTFGIWKVIYE